MESEIKVLRRLAIVVSAAALPCVAPVWAEEQPAKSGQEAPAQLELRRTVKSREYQGRAVAGEERVVKPRDTLWRILVVEKGLSEKRFQRYVILVGELNPGVKRPDVLQVGDTIFIPMQPDEVLGVKPAAASAPNQAPVPMPTAAASKSGAGQLYTVKPGDQLYKVLREQLGLHAPELKKAIEQVKALNPQKKNWDTLLAGETLRLPGAPAPVEQAVALPREEPERVVDLDYGQKITVQENLDLLDSVMRVLGRQTSREGEEVVPLREGTVHIDRGSYPIIQSPGGGQRVILDMQSKITAALKAKMEADAPALPVVSVKKGASLHETVAGLLSRLGFQSLPSNQPVVIQDSGVAVQIKGEWMVTTPEANGAVAQVMVVALTDASGQTPDYLKDYLSLKGMSLKEILLPGGAPAMPAPAKSAPARIERWPGGGPALVDAFLADYGIYAAGSGQFSVMLRDGIRMEAKADKVFEYGGKKIALAFRPLGEEVTRAVQQNEGIKVVEMDLAKLSSRELIGRLLLAVGESATYREQRFQANERGPKDKLTLAVPGYYVAARSLLYTDRDIPKDLERFFGEKGLRVVKFQ